jgi:tight adherence protein B
VTPYLAHLLIVSCVCLVVLVISALLLVRDNRRVARTKARIAQVTGVYLATRADSSAATTGVGREQHAGTLASRAGSLLRYDPAHRHIYPARPPLVLVLALLPSVLFARLAAGFFGPAGWALAPVLSVTMCRAFYGWFEDRHVAKLFRQFPDALAMIVRAVRVGLPIAEALRVAARENPEPTAREFTALVAQTAIGVPLGDALREMAERNNLPEYRFFATALSLQSQTGGGLTETLENLADTIRKRVAAKLRGHALASEARMSSYILGALPLVTGALLGVANPGYMSVLFTDPSGQNLLLLACVLLVVGAAVMRIMIRKSLS